MSFNLRKPPYEGSTRMQYAFCQCWAILLISLVSSPIYGQTRRWTTQDGKFNVEAELISSDEQTAQLKKRDGTQIKVPLKRLSDADLKFIEARAGKAAPAPVAAADLPESVTRFQKSLAGLRKLEAVRLEKRIESLQEPVRLGSKNAKDPIGREAKSLLRDLGARLKVANSDTPYLPRLSPKDFALGQIGELDDDLLLSNGKVEGDIVRVSAVFEELTYFTGNPGIWSRGIVSRPDGFYVQAAFVGRLPPRDGRKHDRTSPADRMLRSHVYEIAERKGGDFVLKPFDMGEVQNWLRDEAKRKSSPKR